MRETAIQILWFVLIVAVVGFVLYLVERFLPMSGLMWFILVGGIVLIVIYGAIRYLQGRPGP